MKQPSANNQILQTFSQTHRLKTRVDADSTLIIPGKFGHIYQYDDHRLAVIVMPFPSRHHYWGVIHKKLMKLGFTVVQNGDCEGAAIFDPTDQEQARAAIRAAGISRKRRLSPLQIDRQISWLRASAGRTL